MPPQVLIAGIGNIFLGDDAFGVEAVAELARRKLPAHVTVRDFGIRGMDLAYALLEGYGAVILVDALPRGGHPGQLYVIQPELDREPADAPEQSPLIETHSMDPMRVLRLVQAMGGNLDRILVVGCEPAPVDDYEDMAPGLSDAVRAAVPQAADLIVQLVNDLSANEMPASIAEQH